MTSLIAFTFGTIDWQSFVRSLIKNIFLPQARLLSFCTRYPSLHAHTLEEICAFLGQTVFSVAWLPISVTKSREISFKWKRTVCRTYCIDCFHRRHSLVDNDIHPFDRIVHIHDRIFHRLNHPQNSTDHTKFHCSYHLFRSISTLNRWRKFDRHLEIFAHLPQSLWSLDRPKTFRGSHWQTVPIKIECIGQFVAFGFVKVLSRK